MKIILSILQFVCVALFLIFVFYLFMILGSSHKVPLQTYLKIITTIMISVVLYFYIRYIKRKSQS
ncbi:hypothetical protein SAMN05421785_1312 [Chryseobacterium gambrini]|uniref:Uncharacterized protein n=1 Tax=Chryseobacterium gambrini TaxID=373672 RepID=A0A1N7R0C3_9FLAO|nr:hypothetical protein SAMN05421785_1312 [Chryseobacterium gambrini]